MERQINIPDCRVAVEEEVDLSSSSHDGPDKVKIMVLDRIFAVKREDFASSSSILTRMSDNNLHYWGGRTGLMAAGGHYMEPERFNKYLNWLAFRKLPVKGAPNEWLILARMHWVGFLLANDKFGDAVVGAMINLHNKNMLQFPDAETIRELYKWGQPPVQRLIAELYARGADREVMEKFRGTPPIQFWRDVVSALCERRPEGKWKINEEEAESFFSWTRREERQAERRAERRAERQQAVVKDEFEDPRHQ